MAEYIEREAAKRLRVSDYAYAAADLLDEVSAADVDPVVHGRWEWREEWDTHPETHSCDLLSCGWYCTKCGIELGRYLSNATGERIFMDDDFKIPQLCYCPNCGARMDGE